MINPSKGQNKVNKSLVFHYLIIEEDNVNNSQGRDEYLSILFACLTAKIYEFVG